MHTHTHTHLQKDFNLASLTTRGDENGRSQGTGIRPSTKVIIINYFSKVLSLGYLIAEV